MRVAFPVFGCKLNQSESEALASAFRSQGFFIVPPTDSADLYIVNTCAVTTKSEQKARRVIRKLSREHEGAGLIITGCYAQMERETLMSMLPESVVVPQDEKDLLLDLPEYLRVNGYPPEAIHIRTFLHSQVQDAPGERKAFRFQADEYAYHSRGFVKIQDGCDNRCSYCIVPLARGGSVSRKPEEVTEEVRLLQKKGYQEIVLTGVNISSYAYGKHTLTSLVETLLNQTDTVRFRLSSLEPDMFSDRLFTLMRSDRICPHVHLPVQSGSDSVLRSMKRRYTSATVKAVVSRLRSTLIDPFIAADIIVGFPGESEDDFRRTVDLVKQCDFSQLHVFQFSPRPGTSAVGMKDKIPEHTAKSRSVELLKLSDSQKTAYISRWNGRDVEVLVERRKEAGGDWYFTGTTENYLKVRIAVNTPDSLVQGKIYRGTIRQSDRGIPLCSISIH